MCIGQVDRILNIDVEAFKFPPDEATANEKAVVSGDETQAWATSTETGEKDGRLVVAHILEHWAPTSTQSCHLAQARPATMVRQLTPGWNYVT